MMVRVIPESEPHTIDPWNEEPPGQDAPGAPGDSVVASGHEGPLTDQVGGPPAAEGPASGGGGRFFGRQKAQQATGDQNRVDLRNTWQIVAGSILVPIGVVFILMAWYGAAHTKYVQQQIPYLVSGSFAGVGCMVLGGLLYWAHWIYRIYDQADQHHEEQLQVMQQTLRALVERLPNAGPDGAFPENGAAPVGPAPGTASPHRDDMIGSSHLQVPDQAARDEVPLSPSSSYVVTPTGSVYHHPACPIIAHHSEGLRVLGPGAVLDMEPCRICLPTLA